MLIPPGHFLPGPNCNTKRSLAHEVGDPRGGSWIPVLSLIVCPGRHRRQRQHVETHHHQLRWSEWNMAPRGILARKQDSRDTHSTQISTLAPTAGLPAPF